MTITTKNIRDIRHLREEGLNDQAISTKLGLSQTSVRRYRRKMGFPPTGRNKKQRMYTVWSAATDKLLCYGNAHECTGMLGLANVSIFYQTVSKTKAGRMKKYVFLVEPYEEERKEGNGCEGQR